jgi:hypothetical protein
MNVRLNLTELQIFTALRTVLLQILPPGTEIIKAQPNRVPEPAGSEFVVMTPIQRARLATNTDTYVDSVFIGSIAGNVLAITTVGFGVLHVGDTLLGWGITDNTILTGQTGGTPGGVGTYTVSNAQTFASAKLAAGAVVALQPANYTIQLDIHGIFSADNQHIITTLFRDEVGVDMFIATGFDVTPLYTGDGRQLPFLNGEQQIETRWSVDVYLQCNSTVTTPMYFIDQLNINFNALEFLT